MLISCAVNEVITLTSESRNYSRSEQEEADTNDPWDLNVIPFMSLTCAESQWTAAQTWWMNGNKHVPRFFVKEIHCFRDCCCCLVVATAAAHIETEGSNECCRSEMKCMAVITKIFIFVCVKSILGKLSPSFTLCVYTCEDQLWNIMKTD